MEAAGKLLKTPKGHGKAYLVCLTALDQPGLQAACSTLVQRAQGPGVSIRQVDLASASKGEVDLFGWQQPDSADFCVQHMTDSNGTRLQPSQRPAAASQILVLSNLCSLLHYLSTPEIIHLLLKLSALSNTRSILVTLHVSKLSSNLRCQLKTLAAAWCELQPRDSSVSTSTVHGNWVTTSCRRTGRLERSIDSFRLMRDGTLSMLTTPPKAIVPPKSNSQAGVLAQPLQLSGSRADIETAVERARQGVVLPHEQLRKLGLARPIFGEGATAPAVPQKARAMGSIHYVRDSDSDHDSDEDPDDDLDM